MPAPDAMADRLAEAPLAGIEGDDDIGLLPGLSHRHDFAACRRAILRQADRRIAAQQEVPDA